MSSRTHARTRAAGCPPVHVMLIVDCQSASMRIGATSTSTALCHSVGNSCAKDSNMMMAFLERCVAFALLVRGTVEQRNDVRVLLSLTSDGGPGIRDYGDFSLL